MHLNVINSNINNIPPLLFVIKFLVPETNGNHYPIDGWTLFLHF